MVLVKDAVTVRLHARDNVVVAVGRIAAGTPIAGEEVTAREAIPSGHKIATSDIEAGEAVRKYGQVVGVATVAIPAGAHVHVHNLAVSDLRAAAERAPAWHRSEPPRSIMGYRRKAGRVGACNCVGVLRERRAEAERWAMAECNSFPGRSGR